MAPARLDWSSSKVSDARLTVELAGELPSGWKQSFETTARLLGHGEWGKVRVKKRSVRVSGVTPGNEEKLRHYLESIVEQANAAHPQAEHERAEVDPDAENGADDGRDAQMTERFRSFADRAQQR